MPETQVRVTFEPHGRAAYVLPGTKVLEAAARAGLTIDTPCGGAATCGKCRVEITRGACEPTDAERGVFDQAELTAGWRLACQTCICRESVIRVPQTSLFADQHQILAERQTEAAGEVLPAVRKVYVELPAPTLADGDADLLRLERQIGPAKADVGLLRELPRKLRGGGFRGTAVLTDHRLVDFEPGDTAGECLGIAVDVGTTTMVASLLDLCSGEELAIVSRLNPQVALGDDVLTRIAHAGASADGLDELHRLVISSVNEMIAELCGQASAAPERIYEIALAGNTTMEHLLCGLDPAQLGEVPFVPIHARGLIVPAAELGLSIHPRGAAYVFPVIGGFVGGDTVAGTLATRLAEASDPVMMVDIGTNGEIVLAHDGKIRAASTAAGPAFEGARISCGMRATAGAVEKVLFDGDLHISVIGDVPPIGLCGSGLIDLAAELLKTGMVSPEGRMLPPEDLPADLAPGLKRRAGLDGDGQPRFLIAEAAGGADEVSLTQRDIRELQLATGAIRAGVSILLRTAGLKTTDLDRVLIAGGFGSFIRRSNAQRIGLLPADVDHRRIHYVGNASLNGAKWALLSTEARKRAETFARQAEHVELSTDPNFQMEFAEAMIFPQG